MDTALPQKFPFILDRNLGECHTANCTETWVCTSCDTVATVVIGANRKSTLLKNLEQMTWCYSFLIDRILHLLYNKSQLPNSLFGFF